MGTLKESTRNDRYDSNNKASALSDLLVSRMLGCDAGLQVSGVGPSPRFGIDDHLFWMPQKDALPTAADGA